jgi:histidyl-tRNA synthetase
VRGLDYYRHTAFEFVTDRLGAQGTVLGGGRFDGLMETLGGPPTPAVGWAAGIERLGMLLDTTAQSRIEQESVERTFKRWLAQIEILPGSRNDEEDAATLAHKMRLEGISVIASFSGNPQKRFDRAVERTLARCIGVLQTREADKEFRLVNSTLNSDEFEAFAHRIQPVVSGGVSSVRRNPSGDPYQFNWTLLPA